MRWRGPLRHAGRHDARRDRIRRACCDGLPPSSPAAPGRPVRAALGGAPLQTPRTPRFREPLLRSLGARRRMRAAQDGTGAAAVHGLPSPWRAQAHASARGRGRALAIRDPNTHCMCIESRRAIYMKALRGFFAGMRQEVAERRAGAARGSASAAGAEKSIGGSMRTAAVQRRRGVDVPRFGSELSDEDLGARLGVPLQGGIRVSHENGCIAIVDHIAKSDGSYADAGIGDTIRYTSQDSRGGDKGTDQALDGANLDLALSKSRGHTVLYFTREGNALVFGKVLECDSVSFEKRSGRTVVVFRMRVVGDKPVDYERLNPEVERDLQDMEAGTFVGKKYTADDYIDRIRKAME